MWGHIPTQIKEADHRKLGGWREFKESQFTQYRQGHRGVDRQPPEGTFQDTWDPKEQHIGPEEIGKQAHKHTGRLTKAKVDELASGFKSIFI